MIFAPLTEAYVIKVVLGTTLVHYFYKRAVYLS